MACKLVGTVRTRHASQAWRGHITEQKDKPSLTASLPSQMGPWQMQRGGSKLAPFSNTELFPGLAPVLAPCSANMKAQDLENIVNAWAVDYTSASAQHNIRAFVWSVSIIKVFLMAKGSLLFLRGLQEKKTELVVLCSFLWDVPVIRIEFTVL